MKTNYLKLGVLCLMMMVGAAVNAQQDTGDVTKKAATTLGEVEVDGTAGSVRVIDNKGTIKYLQVKNGLTQVTNTATTGAGITTTWQLGGTLTDDTYIDASGKLFALDGIAFTAVTASTNAVDKEIAKGNATPGTGWTLLVRNEATGATEKLLFSDLVKGGVHNAMATTATDYVFSGDSTVPNDITKIWVYRNGAKLLNGVDYTIGGTVGAVDVTVKNASGADPEDYAFITGDRLEIQWVQ
ncbi:hypothetical protein [Polaribacter sp.]|uniref:hypothetical protein n=1 Tax=Polaribacter sp. TaxID=1920175 RepID=UPI003EF24B04